MLKLFRDYAFHQVMEDGRPFLDMAHVIACLNRLDAGIPDKVREQYYQVWSFPHCTVCRCAWCRGTSRTCWWWVTPSWRTASSRVTARCWPPPPPSPSTTSASPSTGAGKSDLTCAPRSVRSTLITSPDLHPSHLPPHTVILTRNQCLSAVSRQWAVKISRNVLDLSKSRTKFSVLFGLMCICSWLFQQW